MRWASLTFLTESRLLRVSSAKKCSKKFIGETKRHLHKRFVERRRSILNYGHFPNPTPVSEHFNPELSRSLLIINDVLLISL